MVQPGVLRLVFARGLDELAAALARDIASFRGGDPSRLLAPLPVAVPDRVVARYLNLAIARARSIAVNLEFPYLTNLLGDCLGPEARRRLLDRRRLGAHLATLLGNRDLLAGPEMAPVRRYLGGATDGSGERRAELALELGRLLAEYSLTRPDMIRGWRTSLDQSDWQGRLLTAPQLSDGATLPELYAAAGDAELRPPAAIFAVGLVRFAPGHRIALERLARLCPVHLYAFNPCQEFWEDVEAPADVDDTGCPGLTYWGRAGRATIRQLTELADFDFEALYPEVDNSTLLGRLRGDIQKRRPAPARPTLESDSTVRIASCPSIRRELEHVAESIWALVRERADLAWTDIGVLLAGADRDLYRAQIGAVFAEIGNIPHHLTDVPLVEESRVAEAASWLLELAGTRFERPAMLKVLTHPRIAGIDGDGDGDIDPADWVAWVSDLGVFFGASADDHRDTYLPGDVFHWEQALLRLALGTCIEDDPDERPVPVGSRQVLPLAIAGDRRRSAGRLALLSRSLIADCRWLVDRSMPLAEWGWLLARLITSYVQPTTDREQVELGRCREAINNVGNTGEVDAEAAPPVPFAVAQRLALAALAELRTRRGEPLVDGVAVSPLAAETLTPFEIVFVTGLGEGSFPSPAGDSPLDLRAASRRAGEPTARQRDRYAFLQALCAARGAVHLSYVGRDPQSGERLGASSVIAELRHLCRAELADPGSIEIDVPAHAHDDPGVERREVHTGARRRLRAARLRRPGASSGLTRRQAIDRLRATLGGGARDLIGLVPDRDGRDPAREPPVRDVSTTALARFLESPIDAWLAHVVGVHRIERPDVDAATEPLDLSPLHETLIARGAVCELALATARGHAGGTAAELEAAIDERLARMKRRGTGPAGVIASFHAGRAAALARAWWSGLVDSRVEGATSFAVGRARESEAVGELLEPVVVGGEASIEIHGGVALASGGGGHLVYFDRHAKLGRRRLLRGLIDHLLLAAAHRCSDPVARITTVGPNETTRVELDAFDAEAATEQLAIIAGDLYDGVHDYLLPGDAVLDAYLDGRELAVALRRRAASRPPPWAADWRDRGDFAIPESAAELAERRFGPMLERLRRRRRRG